MSFLKIVIMHFSISLTYLLINNYILHVFIYLLMEVHVNLVVVVFHAFIVLNLQADLLLSEGLDYEMGFHLI